MDLSNSGAGALWLGLMVISITASCLIGTTVAGLRQNVPTWQIFGVLVLVSILVPTGLMFLATRVPPELFRFLP